MEIQIEQNEKYVIVNGTTFEILEKKVVNGISYATRLRLISMSISKEDVQQLNEIYEVQND